MKDTVLIVVTVERAEPKAQDTGSNAGGIFSKAPTRAYSDGWDRVFGVKHPGSDMQHTAEDSSLCSVCNDKSLN